MTTDELVALLRERIAVLTPDARLAILDELMDGFCPHCGGTGGRSCQCWNDE